MGLFDVEHESLEVFALGVVDIDGVISGLMELVEDAHMSTTLSSCCEDGKTELVLVDSLTAAESEYNAARAYLLESYSVETSVALESIAQSILVLGKSWRVEHDEIVVATGTFEILESVFAEAFVLCIGEVESNIGIGELDSACAGIDAVDVVGSATEGIYTETASVAEHVEDVLATGIFFEKMTVVALVNEETGFLAFEPVDVELYAVLKSYVYV